MRTARIWMALAIPGDAPGYDGDKEFGNNVTHQGAELSKGCANHSDETADVKGRRSVNAVSTV
jgi:hypothetical protein